MTWTEHVLWWHVYPLGATGAPVRPTAPEDGVAHRLPRVTAWLDHVVELGLNGVALGPVFASQSHGYDTVDHFRIDPRLGDDADFDDLVAQAQRRGVHVLLDGVFNHVGRTHPAFRDVEQHGPASGTASLFDVDWSGWSPGQPVRAAVFEGHDQLVELDHGSAATADLVTDVMRYWLGRGIAGWRLDAAYAVPPAFWRAVLPRVRHDFPDAWFTGEVIHGDAPDIVRRSGVDSLTQYELWQGIWHSLADRNFHELAHAVRRHDALLPAFVPSTFVGNHDVTRIASAVGSDLVDHAVVLLLTVAGVPSVYYGDEYAATGVKEQRLGGDDAVRPELPPVPPEESDLDPVARRTLATHRQLVSFRRRHPWLHRAHTDVVTVTNEQVVLRTATGDDAAVVALNVADDPAVLPSAGARSVAHGTAEVSDGRVHLPPRGWAVLSG